MALIAMAVWDTEENNRTWMTRRTLESLLHTVDFNRHNLIISDNGSWVHTTEVYEEFLQEFPPGKMQVIFNGENLGTARAINKAWKAREPGEHAVKMDNDVVIETVGWADQLEEIFERDPAFGILGLKRPDCIETPWHEHEWYRSTLEMVKHELGQRWYIVENVHHVMGTCQMYSSACLDKIGYLYQMGGLYGFDDALASIRAQVAGFKTAHVPHIVIDHIDPAGDEYTEWKKKYSNIRMSRYNSYVRAYQSGNLDIYHGADDE